MNSWLDRWGRSWQKIADNQVKIDYAVSIMVLGSGILWLADKSHGVHVWTIARIGYRASCR